MCGRAGGVGLGSVFVRSRSLVGASGAVRVFLVDT